MSEATSDSERSSPHPQRHATQTLRGIAREWGPPMGVLGYGYTTGSAWSWVAAVAYVWLHEPTHKVLMTVAEKVGPALGDALAERIRRWGRRRPRGPSP
jgi:hypothetical protein